MIARSYLQDSHKYEEESEYWLSYAENLATEMLQDEIDQHARFGRSTDTMRMPALMKRIQVMRIALFIDQDEIELAQQLLKEMSSLEYTLQNQEKDTEMILSSLISIVEKGTAEGEQALLKAQKLAKELDSSYEYRQWMLFPQFSL